MEEEQLEVSEQYKKAYNHADMICRFMPHILDGMQTPESEPSEYTRGFEDRVKLFEKEQEAIKSYSPKSKDDLSKSKDEHGRDHEMK